MRKALYSGKHVLADFSADRRLPGDSVVAEKILLLLSRSTVVVAIAGVIILEIVIVILEVVVSEKGKYVLNIHF
jgi:hypothetical protein